jgi:hypothetical protein
VGLHDNPATSCGKCLKQDRISAYNVPLKCVRATTVVVEKHRVLHNLCVCICSLRYPTCNEHAQCCHLWPAALYNIFPHYLINGTIKKKCFWT